MGAFVAVGFVRGVADVAVLQTEQARGAVDVAGDVVVGERHEIAVFIDDFDMDEDDVAGRRCCGVEGGAQGIGTAAGGDGGGGTVGGLAAECSGLVVDVPVEDVGVFVALGVAAYGLAVEQQAC